MGYLTVDCLSSVIIIDWDRNREVLGVFPMTPAPPHPKRCDKSTCKFFDDSIPNAKLLGLIFCRGKGWIVYPIFREQSKIYGCASNSTSIQSEREQMLAESVKMFETVKRKLELETMGGKVAFWYVRDIINWGIQELRTPPEAPR